jgi:hypothetical protein
MNMRFTALALFAVFAINTSNVNSVMAQTAASERSKAGEASSSGRSSVYARHKAKRHTHARRKKTQINERKLAEAKGYKRVSSLVNFPNFFPSLGIIYVKPETLPGGPFLCFDRKDRHVATVYMLPLKDMEDRKKFDLIGFKGKGDHSTFYFNSGHPGVDVPHYHFVIWHIPKSKEVRVAK